MSRPIEILQSVPFNTVQDLGRPDHLALGVSPGGALDPFALQVANAMVGNPDGAACLEVVCFPFRLRFHGGLQVALTGADCEARLNDRSLPPWWALPVRSGDELILNPPSRGRCSYLAVAGGIDVPLVLGSRATDIKTGFGGLEGRGLRRGDRIATGSVTACTPSGELGIGSSRDLLPPRSVTRVRVLAAAELDALTDESRDLFSQAHWKITSAFNRTGAQLDGACLSLSTPADVFSYGVVPGLIQLPPKGRPIIQLAEANTCGGYARIATVIGPDRRLLAQTPEGAAVCFELIDHATAIAALAQEQAALATLKRSLARAVAA